ncbi:NAD(P)H-hydrate dehydratase [Colwellia sp. BRX10-4]|jgi:hydroxyethylthiazole kinase-like uncharacterized protein yjeF|uniref:NAD(P)H-hydrate dehydratase n=1 Tax=Colwellia sp. BRX10-4 TaxID=2759843 RepID=UPI0015F69C33|nr:NAD(P)H-hydrate dehydratase [Colwellia sp. BRX10-4]MBA6397237.1 NAD(P)H-hydrate dehydratase [Colwellia sp. BRX10-4]
MEIKLLNASLPQAAFSAKQVLANEAKVAAIENIEMYSLMKNAGQAVFQHIKQKYLQNENDIGQKIATQRLLVICGKGNNGGDGFVIARLAVQAGFKVSVLLTAKPEELSSDALRAYQAYMNVNKVENSLIIFDQKTANVDMVANFQGKLIIDALFGIGFKGRLPETLVILVATINQHLAKVISVDVPSGLCATTGVVENTAIIANSTVTFIALKCGLVTGQAINHVGGIYFADLALGHAFTEQVNTNITVFGNEVFMALPKRKASSHKGNIGLLLAVGGGEGFAGAIRLSAEASLRSGAALVSICCHKNNRALVFNGRPELMLAPSCAEQLLGSMTLSKAKAYVLGPGLGQNEWSQALFDLVLAQKKLCVIDADGLSLLAQAYQQNLLTDKIKSNRWVLTPHPGEAAALLNCTVTEIERDRFSAVKKIAQQYQCVSVLKGAGSLISDGQQVWVNTTGNSGMASGGMGDVLSGIIAALLMQKSSPKKEEELQVRTDFAKLTALAVYIHGKAADIIAQKHGKIGMLASDLLPIIRQLINNKF